MAHQGGVQALCEVLGTAAGGHIAVGGVCAEEVSLGREGIGERLVALNVLLRTVDDSDEAQLQGVYATRKNVHGVCSVIHQVQLCQDTNGASSHGVDMAGQLEGLGVDKIDVCRRDGENDAVGLCDVLCDQVAGLLLDIAGLIANRDLGLSSVEAYRQQRTKTDLCETRQIDQGQTKNMRRVDLEVDGLTVDALVVSSNSGRLVLNLPLDLTKVVEATTRDVIELSPFVLTSDRGRGVWHVDLIALGSVGIAGDVDELQNERTTSYDAASSWEKVATDNVLQYRRLS